ncbi:MAG: calcium/sodium antiporter [bacterium]|nr:calcium/sodium antiporter [bacterium]
MVYVILVVGFFLLIKGADYFVDGSSNLAKALGVPTLIIGLTVVAFGTSAPETVVSLIALVKGSNEIAVSNVVGSNIFNLLVVLGVCGLFGGVKAKREVITRDFLFSILASLLLIFIAFDSFFNGDVNTISRGEGFVLLSVFGIYLYSLLLTANNEKKLKKERYKFTFKDFLMLTLGLAAIIVGGELTVKCAQKIAISWGVSETLVGLTIVSIGTSLPELVTSIIAVRKGETDIAIGNVIGSNIFNILLVLGVSASVSSLSITNNSIIDAFILLIASIICYIFTCFRGRIGSKKGFIMLIFYVMFLVYIIAR